MIMVREVEISVMRYLKVNHTHTHTYTHPFVITYISITLGSKATDDGMQIKSSGDLEESAEDNDPVGEDVEHLFDVGGSGDFETLGGKLQIVISCNFVYIMSCTFTNPGPHFCTHTHTHTLLRSRSKSSYNQQ